MRLMAATVAMWHWNMSQYVIGVIRQSKRTAQTRGERPRERESGNDATKRERGLGRGKCGYRESETEKN